MSLKLEKVMCVATVFALTTGSVWADCQADYNKAVMMIGGVKQQALNNEKISKDDFAAEFKPVIDNMQKGQCASELMALLKFIQEEQKQYPAPAGAQKTPKMPEF